MIKYTHKYETWLNIKNQIIEPFKIFRFRDNPQMGRPINSQVKIQIIYSMDYTDFSDLLLNTLNRYSLYRKK